MASFWNVSANLLNSFGSMKVVGIKSYIYPNIL
jgi:hypothetical protein